jgi:hypothetical protein
MTNLREIGPGAAVKKPLTFSVNLIYLPACMEELFPFLSGEEISVKALIELAVQANKGGTPWPA